MTSTIVDTTCAEPALPSVRQLRAVREKLQRFIDEADAIVAGKFSNDTEHFRGEWAQAWRRKHDHDLTPQAREVVRRSHDQLRKLRYVEAEVWGCPLDAVPAWLDTDDDHVITRGYD